MKNLHQALFAISLFILLIPPLSAQQSKLRKAQHYMESLRYDSAIEIYHKLYQRSPSSREVLAAMAKAYHKSEHFEEAIAWYAQAAKQDDLPPEFYYYYGQILLQKGNCSDAQSQFTKFLENKPYDSRRSILEDVCSYWETISSRKDVSFRLSHPSFNSEGSDLGAAFYNGKLVFGSVRQTLGHKKVSYDLYCVEPVLNEGNHSIPFEFGSVSSFSTTLNSALNEAIITFSPDYRAAYFTRNRLESLDEKFPISRLEILVSQQNEEDVWSPPKALLFNKPGYSTAHPALTPDGNRLFFASDRPGGFGGKDIYVCERNGLDWSTPVNLGPVVNTEGDELYPFFHTDGILYFASDGQLGLGGHDVFKVSEQKDGIWGEVLNLGFPINSEADDFGLILSKDGRYGFLTSNREGGKGEDDIYAFQAKRVMLELYLVDPDGQPIPSMIALKEKNETDPVLTDENGHLSFWLTYDECRYFTVATEKYLPFTAKFCATDAKNTEKMTVNWMLEEKVTTPISDSENYFTIKGDVSAPRQLNIYYDLGRASVRTESIEALNHLMAMLENYPTVRIEISSHTDARGTAAFNKNLSRRRADAIVNYLVKKGISPDRLVAKGYGEERLINSCNDVTKCTEEEHQLNRRTEFRVLEQSYGQSN